MPYTDRRSLISFISERIEDIYNLAVLPVTPEEISVASGSKIIKTSLLSLGEVSQLGELKLDEISFSSFFPESEEDSYVNQNRRFLSPQQWVNLINMIRREPVYMIITLPHVEGSYFINDFQYRSVGEGHDIYYSMQLVQNKTALIRKVDTRTNRVIGNTIPFDSYIYAENREFYTVVPGDTLETISLKVGVSVKTLRELNGIIDSSILSLLIDNQIRIRPSTDLVGIEDLVLGLI